MGKERSPCPLMDRGFSLFGGESDVVGGGGSIAAPAGPVGVEELTAGFVRPLVGMGAEVVALCLEQIGG